MSFKSYESLISPFFRASLIFKEYSVGLKKGKKKRRKKEIKQKMFSGFLQVLEALGEVLV